MANSNGKCKKYCKYPVVIIGGGFCGLAALKICKENGLEAVCYEKTNNFGGLWRFRDVDYNGVASVTRNTIINTSKEMSAFSDFTPPENSANFMHNTSLLDYLEKYAQKFDLFGDVHYRHEVIRVSKSDSFQETGEWTVCIRRHNKEQTAFEDEIRQASAVLVCIGHHVYPNIPNFPGQSEFHGKMIHTHTFKENAGFENQRVLVIGLGNSAMDAAVEVSLTGSQVYLSTRRGGWILQRIGLNGIPTDFQITRFTSLLYKLFPKYSINSQEKMMNANFDHELYNLKPKHRYDGQHPSLSDMLPSRIIGGAVIVKSDVLKFTEHGVVFKGEENRVYELDAVIFATGYKIRFPFLDEGILENSDNQVMMYRRIIPPKVATHHPTLGFVGLIQPVGAIFPIAEMQSRWMAKILKGEILLPSEAEIFREVKQYERDIKARYVESQRHTIQVDFVPYLDSLAKDVGCIPNLARLFFTDNELFRAVFFGPAVAYQYRLQGSHAWSGARKAILTVGDRVRAAFNTRMFDDAAGEASKSKRFTWWNFSLGLVLHCFFSFGIYYAVKAKYNP